MIALLDTHAWIWSVADDEQLGPRTTRLLLDDTAALLLSVASIWELSIKAARGKLEVDVPLDQQLPGLLRRQGIGALDVRMEHAVRVQHLPRHHEDPFDRVLVAQAQALEIPIVTVDRQIGLYDVEVLDART